MLTEEQKELRAKFLVALKSGEYKQGRGRLKRGDQYCVLGLMCEVSQCGNWINKLGNVGWAHKACSKDFNPEYSADYYMKHAADLPKEVLEAYNISHKFESTLMVLNDFANETFSEIAQFLESIDFINNACIV